MINHDKPTIYIHLLDTPRPGKTIKPWHQLGQELVQLALQLLNLWEERHQAMSLVRPLGDREELRPPGRLLLAVDIADIRGHKMAIMAGGFTKNEGNLEIPQSWMVMENLT